MLNALYEAFATIFHWVLIPLPLGLFALGAAHVAEADRDLLVALVRTSAISTWRDWWR